MLPDRVSNPGPLTYESGALPIALCGPARRDVAYIFNNLHIFWMKIIETNIVITINSRTETLLIAGVSRKVQVYTGRLYMHHTVQYFCLQLSFLLLSMTCTQVPS